MIFEQIKLHNFGIYQGEHTANLDVSEHNKPVVLFMVLNGGGKTTLLDSFTACLYVEKMQNVLIVENYHIVII